MRNERLHAIPFAERKETMFAERKAVLLVLSIVCLLGLLVFPRAALAGDRWAVPAPGAMASALPQEITNSVDMKLKLIPAGEFMMGSPDSEKGRRGDEQQHQVRITKPFYLGVYLVTQAQYEKVMGNNPSWFSANGGGKQKVAGKGDTSGFPVENVGWDDAVEFCQKLSAKENKKEKRKGKEKKWRMYRLPTEAEWEYACRPKEGKMYGLPTEAERECACRSGSTSAYCFGYAPFGFHCDSRTHMVWQGEPNAWGLYDMLGNMCMWEWCADWYDGKYYANSPVDDPTGPSGGSDRVYRGGSWDRYPQYPRAANRGHYTPDYRICVLGFRVAFTPP